MLLACTVAFEACEGVLQVWDSVSWNEALAATVQALPLVGSAVVLMGWMVLVRAIRDLIGVEAVHGFSCAAR